MLKELINDGKIKDFLVGRVKDILNIVSVLLSSIDVWLSIMIEPVLDAEDDKEFWWYDIMSLPIGPHHDIIKFIPPNPANDVNCKISS